MIRRGVQYRKVKIFSGHVFNVPNHIVRLDDGAEHGWQVRYGKSKMFSDHSQDGAGAGRALRTAKKELTKRIAALPAATGLKMKAQKNKVSKLPPGLSGPYWHVRKGRTVAEGRIQVTLPRFGQKSRNTGIYIGTERTDTPEKRLIAIAKAKGMRDEAVRRYQNESTNFKRAAAKK